MKGTKKFRFFKRCVALLMVVFMLITVPVFEGETAKAATVVNIPDANLKAGINGWLGQPADANITDAQLANIEHISAEGVSNLTGLEYCKNLETISIIGNGSKFDLNVLKGCSNLEMLMIDSFTADDYSVISSFSNLTTLGLNDTNIAVLPDMSAATNLKTCNLDDNKSLTSIAGLKNCNNLTNVYINDTAVTDISPLAGKTKLVHLGLDGVKITSSNKSTYMSVVSSMANVEYLSVAGCDIGNEHTSMFDGCTGLTDLDVANNNITDLSFLVKHKNKIEVVDLEGNPIKDGSQLAQITSLQNVGIENTNISDYSFISSLPNFDSTNSSYGFIWEWNEYSRRYTYGEDITDTVIGATEYRIKNKVKDHNGKYVEPVDGDDYTYDSDTNEIVLSLSDGVGSSGYIYYDIDLKSAKGANLYAAHRLYYDIDNLKELKFTQQPESKKIKPGENTSFIAQATGEGPITYQWYKDGKAITDETSFRNININNADRDDAGEYYVVATDKYGNTITSDKVKLVINVVPLVITTQPEDVTVDEGDEISFSVAATGDGTLTYQWYKDGNPIAGATANTYTNKNVDETDIGEYYVEVSDGYDTIESDKVQAKVNLNPLKITTQPKSVTVGEEKTATLSVVAVAGKGTLTYQWYKDGNPIAGATAATLKIADATASDAGKYHVIVKDARETVKSTDASVVVELIPLEITAQPVGAQLKEDAAASLKVTATGKGTLTYQWYKDGNPIAGATKDTLEIAAAGASDEGEYYVVVSDVRNSANSDEVSVTVELIPLEITAQPVSTTLGEGKDGSLSVTATGKGTLTYQWYKDGTAIEGATAATLEIPEASTADEGKYYVVVKDVRNTVESEEIDVKVALIPLEITGQPVGVELTEGGSTSLVVKATGKGTLSYQWYKGDKAIEGATKDTLLLEEVKVEDSGEYYVVVKDERNQTASVKALVKVSEKTTEAPTTENTTEAPNSKPPVDGPATGDGPMPVVFVMMLLAGMASLGLAKLRKKNI